jgi:class 3 adenylate cyclase/tetratricopeptide (TPR) repeat protein
MLACPTCGTDNPEGSKFCRECATPLDGRSRQLAEERKVITALFCDLVGFTATSESADPEDVNQMLNAYATMARREIEVHGGVVEKFIGDAVVGVFGVPAAHEDDPERAVRAGLRIAEAAEELSAIGEAPLRLRVGINTGEALVRLGINPGSGEGFLRGDAINTASRLQAVAPEMGVAVGEATYEATAQVFDYQEQEPPKLKGKAKPVRVFVATAPRSRFGSDLVRSRDTAFIGREIDLAILKGVFDKALAANSVQLVTVVGEPGIGKSRIVSELFRYVDDRTDLTTWRQGRCLPYGEGITFWAMGEILKAHAGILESDDPPTANAKLEIVLPEGSEREWFRQRLLPLLGIEATSTAERDELFTAWRRFLEHIAERDPTVLVFEDLHWADEAMLSFLEHLADRAEGVPMLVLGTARPELFERYPDYARGLRNHTPINLAPLSQDETARLVSALLEASVIPAELQAPILERSGGNPLYAEEFVRLLRDKGLLARKGSSWELAEGAEIPFPDSVQSMIAARLDTLPPERKAMLADAAVVGKVFWSGAIAKMGDLSELEVTEAMRELSRKELVRPSRRSSMGGETEYAFWHVLARDVAYSQIPRASRASRHMAAAAWIESKAPQRLEDLAETLAYHYTSALELAKAAGEAEQVGELEPPALRFLTLAGERALGLDTAAALDAFERALALTPEGSTDRPETLARFGEAALQSAHFFEAAEALEEAIAMFRELGEVLAAARAMLSLESARESLNYARGGTLNSAALELLEPLPPGPELVDALAGAAFNATLDGQPEEGIALAERALEVAEEAGLARPAKALGYRGVARCGLGDAGGLADLREALALAIQAGKGREAALLYNNLGVSLRNSEGPLAALQNFAEGLSFAEARGLKEMALAIRTSALPAALEAGELEEALAGAAELGEHAEAAGDELDLVEIYAVQAMALALRGHARDAARFLDRLVVAARQSGRPDMMAAGLGAAAIVRVALGERDDATAHLREIETTPGLNEALELALYLPHMVRAANSIGEPALAGLLVGHLTPRYPYAEHTLVAVNAALAEARGETNAAVKAYANAAARWEGFGVVPEQGFALLGQGRCLLKLSRQREASRVLQLARETFTRCGMRQALDETDALLARATALSS